MEPTDARLAALYDADNPAGADHEFFRTLVDRIAPRSIIDLGCGTGLLTVTLGSAGRDVVGIDPDQGMLDIARGRPEGERVEWLLGDARDIPHGLGVELVLMTGNVVQHLDPDHWRQTLVAVSSVLRRGGVLAFDNRNPSAQAWRSWTRDDTLSTRPTADGPLTEWMESTEPDGDATVVLTACNRWEATGEQLTVRQPLTFRSLARIEHDLGDVGIGIERVWGGWHGEPFVVDSPVMIVEARRR
ncbi:MAG: class I SAM-dependent methyltransferase [Acidimicrobiales bacterium]|nr:class I SAM-dependent methyltransferase [Acidimicrobiales bacterium]